jgi:hypothetical protein
MEVSGFLHPPSPAALTLGKNPLTYWVGGWLGVEEGLGDLEMSKVSCPCRDSNLGFSCP